MNRVIKAHELDYLKGYSIYVRLKEREMRELVTKLNERDETGKEKDEIIRALKLEIKRQCELMMK